MLMRTSFFQVYQQNRRSSTFNLNLGQIHSFATFSLLRIRFLLDLSVKVCDNVSDNTFRIVGKDFPAQRTRANLIMLVIRPKVDTDTSSPKNKSFSLIP
jgi:hypothetical protein